MNFIRNYQYRMKSSFAPVILFVYNRYFQTKNTIDALLINNLAKDSELIIYSDAAKNDIDLPQIKKVRSYLKTIKGFKNITIIEAETNLGLAKSIIEGVTETLKKHEQIIVLEDDLITSPNFLNFMNQGLNYYQHDSKIFSISGYSKMKYDSKRKSDVFFTLRSSSWGWATWKDRWDIIDWNVLDYEDFHYNANTRKLFNQMGSDMSSMLDKQMSGIINSWAIRWCYHQFKNDLYSVHPYISKIQNIGFSKEASNTKEKFSRFHTKLDNSDKKSFIFSKNFILEKSIIKEFTKPYSLKQRALYKIINLFFKY